MTKPDDLPWIALYNCAHRPNLQIVHENALDVWMARPSYHGPRGNVFLRMLNVILLAAIGIAIREPGRRCLSRERLSIWEDKCESMAIWLLLFIDYENH